MRKRVTIREGDDEGGRRCQQEKGKDDDKEKGQKVEVVPTKTKEEGDLQGGSVHLTTRGNFTAEKLRPVVIELFDGN